MTIAGFSQFRTLALSCPDNDFILMDFLYTAFGECLFQNADSNSATHISIEDSVLKNRAI